MANGMLPIKISSGFIHDCIVGTEGKGYCMGDNEDGQCDMVNTDTDALDVNKLDDTLVSNENTINHGYDRI